MAQPYPFSAIVGQDEMKDALLMAAVEPALGGVLVFGDRGTGKSTAVRALAELVPELAGTRGCRYNCDPAHPAEPCPVCATASKSDRIKRRAPMVDLPLGATEDRVCGALDIEKALVSGERAFEPGLLAKAHRGFLYVDEVNLLEDHLVDLLLDVAASGVNVVEREGLSVRHPARFVLVGSGNPEEGELRPQLLDRFGLSVDVSSPRDIASRIEVLKRRDAYEQDPEVFHAAWAKQESRLASRIVAGRKAVNSVVLSERLMTMMAHLCMRLGVDGLRGELTLMRAARAKAALARRTEATVEDVLAVAPMALRHRLRRDPLDEAGSKSRVDRAISEVAGRRSEMPDPDASHPVDPRWGDALLAARVLAAGAGLIGGVRLRAGAGPVRDRWLDMLRAMLAARPGANCPWIRIPSSSAAGRLTGGIDITATLTAGRPVHEKGLLARADGGFIVLGMAERLAGASAAIIGRTLDDAVTTGASGQTRPARFSVVALDEGTDGDEEVPAALADRLTLDLRLDGLSIHDAVCDPDFARELGQGLPDAAPGDGRFGRVPVHPDILQAAAAISLALPASPIRRALDLIRVARILAMLEGSGKAVDAEHLATAVRLCLGLTLNVADQAAQTDQVERQQAQDMDEEPSPNPPADGEEPGSETAETDMSEDDMMVAAAAASRAVLAELDRPDRSVAAKLARTGKSGGFKSGSRRGRPAGIVSRPPYAEARPDIVSTLRAAIPWQRLRNPDFALSADGSAPRLRILPSDFRYIRFRHRTESTAIFAVDASGSTAMERLAEAKGAIELLLGDCYVRRDQVALITFRGLSAETLLEPTRSLVRAKRSLTGLPGGGPTPLAGAIRRSLEIAGMVQRRGQSPLIVYLTDGSGNIALDGKPDRARARDDAQMLARQGAALGYRSILIDISRRPRETTRELARSMQAQYCPLPIVSASAVNAIVSAELQRGPGQGDRQGDRQ